MIMKGRFGLLALAAGTSATLTPAERAASTRTVTRCSTLTDSLGRPEDVAGLQTATQTDYETWLPVTETVTIFAGTNKTSNITESSTVATTRLIVSSGTPNTSLGEALWKVSIITETSTITAPTTTTIVSTGFEVENELIPTPAGFTPIEDSNKYGYSERAKVITVQVTEEANPETVTVYADPARPTMNAEMAVTSGPGVETSSEKSETVSIAARSLPRHNRRQTTVNPYFQTDIATDIVKRQDSESAYFYSRISTDTARLKPYSDDFGNYIWFKLFPTQSLMHAPENYPLLQHSDELKLPEQTPLPTVTLVAHPRKHPRAFYPYAAECTEVIIIQSFVSITVTRNASSPIHTRTTTVMETVPTTVTTETHPEDVIRYPLKNTTLTTALVYVAPETVTKTMSTKLTSTTTSYAACASNNFLGPLIPGQGYISNVFRNDDDAFRYDAMSNVTSAVDCCNKCAETTYCDGSIYKPATSECNIVFTSREECQMNSQAANRYYYVINDANKDGAYIISNGRCGYITYGGNDSSR